MILKVEDADNPTEIDEKQLTLKIISSQNRVDYLWEIGGGSNWMGYPISALLALQVVRFRYTFLSPLMSDQNVSGS
ncbi:DUF3732 domain-containing protein [Flavitalea sp.]|nr:DUF3732 domain-containing protein [Flavitalea sp.]